MKISGNVMNAHGMVIEDYVHRIRTGWAGVTGIRTGWAGVTGVAYTFSDQDRKHAADLVKVLDSATRIALYGREWKTEFC
ncbi:hypothetical protein FRX31_005942 [Thalictrum thalictroides]|uniref:Uncharacterized protein n=1 Tax=Thalictrum thalictroides TaxID=46969 RepID=A0A7J6X474_THATH|nr:hypothetical protein FRX31_005942 [Thalictrum thalictroides]